MERLGSIVKGFWKRIVIIRSSNWIYSRW